MTCKVVYYNVERKVADFTLSQVDIHPKETTFITYTHNAWDSSSGLGGVFVVSCV